MKIEEIIVILQNRLLTLNEGRKQAVATGNLEQVIAIDADILSTQASIEQIQSTIS